MKFLVNKQYNKNKNKYNFIVLYKNLHITYKLLNNFLVIPTYELNLTEQKNKLGSFLLTGGKLNSNMILTFSVFQYIYKIFYKQAEITKNLNYTYTKEFLFNFLKYKNFNNILFILNWIYSWVKPMFLVECNLVPKKYRKKIKKKYLYKIKYLNIRNRMNKSLQWVNNYKNSLAFKSKFNRELFCYLDLMLNYKSSFIYLKKITTYKKVFKV